MEFKRLLLAFRSRDYLIDRIIRQEGEGEQGKKQGEREIEYLSKRVLILENEILSLKRNQ